MDSEFIQHLSKVLPGDGVQLGYPPANDFIPKQDLIAKKKDRTDADSASVPSLLTNNNSSTKIWFKQDDTFNQPVVSCKLLLKTLDNGYP